MWRSVSILAVSVAIPAAVWAQPSKAGKKSPDKTSQQKSLEKKVQQNPNDVKAIEAYAGYMLYDVELALGVKPLPRYAAGRLDQLEALLAELQIDDPAAKRQLSRIRAKIGQHRDKLAAIQTPADELEKRLAENPDDGQAISRYTAKLAAEIESVTVREDADQGAKRLEALKARLLQVRKAAKTEASQFVVDAAEDSLLPLEKKVGKLVKFKHLVTIGQDAPPLKAEAWIGGPAFTDADLKGKVVVLHFFVAWHDPAATFAHLRQWQEKYASKGLVTIGITRYYNAMWDDSTKMIVGSNENVEHSEENDALAKFAKHHALKHRIAIDGSGDLSRFYGDWELPFVVVIDQEGKVRWMGTDATELTNRQISESVEALVAAGDGNKR